MREAREKAAKEAPKEERGSRPQDKPAKELEVDFSVKETGQTRTIAGYNARKS